MRLVPRILPVPLAVLLAALLVVLALGGGCGRDVAVAPHPVPAPDGDGPRNAIKDGSEALGAPSLELASGSGLSHGGVSLVGVTAADLTVAVPTEAVVRQVLLYWAGGTTAEAGDDEISLDGVPVHGQLIGGPTWFYGYQEQDYRFSAYRADITALDLVQPGVNTLTISDFAFTTAAVDENDGASVVVIWDDGSPATLAVRDGLDMAYFGFSGVLNGTEPQTFTVAASTAPRLADLVILAASVGLERPNRVLVSTAAGVQAFDDPLGDAADGQWDSRTLPVLIPAGIDRLTVQLVSTDSEQPRGASLGWVCAALAAPSAVGGVQPWTVAGTVFDDTNRNQRQDDTEVGLPGVAVDLRPPTGAAGPVLSLLSGPDGRYQFAVPAGVWEVVVDPLGHRGSFNAELAAWFSATGPLSHVVTVGPDSAGNDFAFVPEPQRLIDALSGGDLPTDGLTPEMWRQIIRCAILAETTPVGGQDGIDGLIRRPPVNGDDCGEVRERLFYDAATLRELIGQVSALYLPVPFQFEEGRELTHVYKLLAAVPRNDEEALRRELLATELNYVSGRGVPGRLDLVGSVAGWAESVLAWVETRSDFPADKGRSTDISAALQILSVINTGGGGGVDE